MTSLRRSSAVTAISPRRLGLPKIEPLEPSALAFGIIVIIVVVVFAAGDTEALDARERHVSVHLLTLLGGGACVERWCRRGREGAHVSRHLDMRRKLRIRRSW